MENSRILIIDDDRELCILIKKSVENEGIEADFAEPEEKGWKCWNAGSITLLFWM